MATREEKAEELARYEEEKANWPLHKIRVTQIFKVTRSVEISVKAESTEKAIESAESCDLPSCDEFWGEPHWDLQNEEYEAV